MKKWRYLSLAAALAMSCAPVMGAELNYNLLIRHDSESPAYTSAAVVEGGAVTQLDNGGALGTNNEASKTRTYSFYDAENDITFGFDWTTTGIGQDVDAYGNGFANAGGTDKGDSLSVSIANVTFFSPEFTLNSASIMITDVRTVGSSSYDISIDTDGNIGNGYELDSDPESASPHVLTGADPVANPITITFPSTSAKTDDFRIGQLSYSISLNVSGPATFTTTPDDNLTVEAFYPATLGTNALAAAYTEGPLGTNVQVTAINFLNDPSNAFSVVTSLPFTLPNPAPSNSPLEIAFDATAATNVVFDNNTEGFTVTGSVEVVWTEIGSGTLNTNTLDLTGRYRNPAVDLNIDSSLSMELQAPATAVTNDLTVSYDQGRPGHTNVQITAISITNATAAGFASLTAPFTLTEPAPSNSTISIEFDNAVGGLVNKQSATADLLVTWQEVGGTTNYTETIPVSVKYVDLPQGVIQLSMANPIVGVDTGHGGTFPLNDFATFTNKWYGQNVSYSSAGYLRFQSTANNRSAVNIVEAGTAGQDNFGPVDTTVLTNGLWRYDFEYEVLNADTNDIWSFDAYALVNQEPFPVSNNTDYVEQDLATGVVEYKGPAGNGSAYPEQHPSGSLRGSNGVGRTTGSIYLNVQDGWDAMFHVTSSGGPDVRLYELTLTREGDFDPNTDLPNAANAVIAADFNDISASNSIIQTSVTDANSNGMWNVQWRGGSVSWQSQSLRSTSAGSTYRAPAIIVRSGQVGYDDVGVQDTIALTSGVYDLTLDLEISGAFGGEDVRVEFYSMSQAASNNVDDVRFFHGSNVYINVRGDATTNLLGSASFSVEQASTSMSLTNLNVLPDEDIAVVFYHALGPDLNIDNVELVRTGDAVLSGYEGWAQGFAGFVNKSETGDPDADGVINLLEYALNGDPTVGDSESILPASYTGTDGSSNWLYYVHTERTDDGSLTYNVELAENLAFPSWGTVGVDYVGESAPADNYKSVTNRTDTVQSTEFIRLQVEKN